LCGLAISIGEKRFLLGEDIHRAEYFGKAILDYVEKNERWPDADKWCDEIGSDVFGRGSRYAEDKQPQCKWAINKHSFGLVKDMPDDMVLLFETDFGWNKTGGVEIAKGRTPEIILVVFGNGDALAIPEKNISKLRWQVDQKTKLSYDPKLWCILAITAVIIIASGIVIAFRKYARRHWILTTCIAVISTGASFILGGLAIILYWHGSDSSSNFDIVLVIIPGFLVGTCFVPILGKIRAGLHNGQGFISRGTVAGAITGIIGSTIVHVLLMIYYEDANILKPLGGAGFGILAGMVLGCLTASIIQNNYKQQTCCGTPEKPEAINAVS